MYSSAQLSHSEAEDYINELKPFELNEVGTKKWFRQHERLEKLNIQATKNAANMEDEFVKDFFISKDKVAVVIHSLITTECWRKQLLPTILHEMHPAGETTAIISFPLSILLQHLVTVTGLMATLLFHSESCENAGDYLIDLVDFCHRQLVNLVDRSEDDDVFEVNSRSFQRIDDVSEAEELQIQARRIDFQIGIKSITLLCYIIEHLQNLPLGIRHRLLCCHDTPMVLVQLLECPPWIRRRKDDQAAFKYDGFKWAQLEDPLKVDKISGQVWIALFRLIHDLDSLKKYDMTNFRKEKLLKLRPLLHHTFFDQMPYLEPLRRTLEELAIFDPRPAKKDLIIEQTPVIWESLQQKWNGKWESVACQQIQSVFNYSHKDIQEQAKILSGLYDFDDVLEDLLEESPKCSSCGKRATKRCSKCKSEWYCEKQCQVDHWPKHKLSCALNS